MTLEEITAQIRPLDRNAEKKVRLRWGSLCKPLGGFGLFEEIIAQLGGIQRTDRPSAGDAVIVIMGADNGVVAQGVSQSGQEVTAQVLENMVLGKSSVCVMSNYTKTRVVPVNIGISGEVPQALRREMNDLLPPGGAVPPARQEDSRFFWENGIGGILEVPVSHGTDDISRGPAMAGSAAEKAVLTGIRIARRLKKLGYDLLIPGEMGIGNTTTSSAVACALTGRDPRVMTGAGAGLSAAGVAHKAEVVRKALEVNLPDPFDPVGLIAKVGGFDIAGMCGLYLGAASCGMGCLVDGFISLTAADLAVRLAPCCRDYLIATHKSAEPAFGALLEDLGLKPVLDAGMHLGEATGAAAVYTLLREMLYVYDTLPRFEEGHVKNYSIQADPFRPSAV